MIWDKKGDATWRALLANTDWVNKAKICTGASVKVPPIKGVEQPQVAAAIDVLLDKVSIGNHVVIIGGGQVGYEVVYDLLREGKAISVVEFLDGIIAGVAELVSVANVLMLEELLNYYKADTVILETGYKVEDSSHQALQRNRKEIYLYGDSKAPSNIMHAVANGNKMGREI